MTTAYDALSDRMQNFISGLEAVHDFKPFKTLFAETEEGWSKLRDFEEIYRAGDASSGTRASDDRQEAIFVNPQFTLFH